MSMFDATNIPLLGKALDAYSLRQKVSAANIANITTPGYKSQSVSFEDQLASASEKMIGAATTNPRHMRAGAAASPAGIEAEVHDTAQDNPEGYNDMASGLNDVDIDLEMAELAKNQIRFKFGSRMLGETFKGIQKAIRGTV